MNQPYKRLGEARRAGSGPALSGRWRTACGGATTGLAGTRRGGGKPVAYSILFQ